MKTYNKLINLTSVSICAAYFILRFIYEVSHIMIINIVSSTISLVAGIVLFIIGLMSFFHDKSKKEFIQPLVISTILIVINVVDYFL